MYTVTLPSSPATITSPLTIVGWAASPVPSVASQARGSVSAALDPRTAPFDIIAVSKAIEPEMPTTGSPETTEKVDSPSVVLRL